MTVPKKVGQSNPVVSTLGPAAFSKDRAEITATGIPIRWTAGAIVGNRLQNFPEGRDSALKGSFEPVARGSS